MNSEDTVATLTGAKPNGHELAGDYSAYGGTLKIDFIPPAGYKPSGPEMEQLPDGKGWAVKKGPATKIPEHYSKGDFRPWLIIDDQNLGYYEGCAIDMIIRARWKGDEKGDLRKAIDYLTHRLELLEQTS